MLGANALLAPTAVLAGDAPSLGRTASLGTSTRKDLAARLGVSAGTRLSVERMEMSGQRFAHVVHTQRVPLGSVDKRLKGVTIAAAVPVIVGDSGGRAAVMGALPEPLSTEREVQAFVDSLLRHGQIEFASGKSAAAAPARGAAAGSVTARQGAGKQVPRETHRVVSSGKSKTLVRVRFHCRCCG
jgi:hypothetical protein